MGLAEWARYIDVEFVEVTSNSEVGLLRFGGTTYSGASVMPGPYPNWYYAAGGDTWFSAMMRKMIGRKAHMNT